MGEALTILLEKGGLASALLVVTLFTIYRLYLDQRAEREAHRAAIEAAQAALQAEHEQRLQDSKENTLALLNQNERVHQALTQVATVMETIGKKTQG